MECIPNEVRIEIVRHLRQESDRKALVVAYPTWGKIVEREDMLRNPTIDESGQRGLSTEDFLATFEGSGLRRRQFLEEVRVERFVGAAAYYETCCPVTAQKHLTGGEFGDCISRLMEGIHEITERAAKAGLNTPGIALSLRACADDLISWETCSSNHTDDGGRRALEKTLVSAFMKIARDPDPTEPKRYKGVDELCFGNQGLFQGAHMGILWAIIQTLTGLRVVRLDLQESVWSYKRHIYRQYETICVENVLEVVQSTQPIEDVHVRMSYRSPRNEFRPPKEFHMAYQRATVLFTNLSLLPSLTVLRLSGQFCAPVRLFDLIQTTGFPALTTFYLGIGPQTDGRSWFFVKDTTPLGWSAAAQDPAWAECVTLTATGTLPQDPLPGPEDDLADEAAVFAAEPAKRNRTLPHHETLGRLLLGAAKAAQLMPKIETFSICLEDDFSGDDTPYPFVPPFLTRVFEMHFVLTSAAVGGGGNAALTWKLGQKVGYWRPPGSVLEAWQMVAMLRRGAKLDISYVE